MKDKYILLISLICILVVPNCFSQKLRSVKEWESRFLDGWDKEYKIAGKQSLSNDSWQFYNLAYSIDANSVMFQATGDTKYLDRAFLYINNVIESAEKSSKLPKSQFKDSFLGWANHSAPSQGDDGKEYPLFESFCWRYVTQLLYVINRSPSILSNKKYKRQYDKLLEFTEKNIYKKWTSRGMKNIYRSNVHMSSHWARIAMDLYCITKKREYKVIVDHFVSGFVKQKVQHSSSKKAIVWKVNYKKDRSIIQDVGHGNAVVGTIIEMYERKIAFEKKDIDNLIVTFNEVVWKSDSTFADRFDGTGKGSGWFTDGLIKLGRYDKQLQLRIEKHTKGRSTQFFGNGAYNAVCLLNSKPLYPELK